MRSYGCFKIILHKVWKSIYDELLEIGMERIVILFRNGHRGWQWKRSISAHKKIQFPLDNMETIVIAMHNRRNIYIDNRFNSLEY